MNNKNPKLLVLFPGKIYAASGHLLFYAHAKYQDMGYKIISIDYGNYDDMNEIKSHVLSQIEKVDFSVYNEIVFLSKSMGTVIAGWLEERLVINIRHVYLTPLESTLQYMKANKNISIVISGTADRFLSADKLAEHCIKEKIKLEMIEGADHSLSIPGNVYASIDILKQIVELY